MSSEMPLVMLRYLLRQSVSAETSLTPDRWSPENPFYGHCAVFTLVVQNYRGGRIQRGVLPGGWPERLGYRTHYWNVLDNGDIVDLSREQFPPDFPYDDFVNGKIGDTSDKLDKREYILKPAETQDRYGILTARFSPVFDANPIFRDPKYRHCWELAFSEEGKCAKMRFACLVFDDTQLVAESPNSMMSTQFGRERFCSLDGSRCIREDINFRTDAVIGDCGHSAIWCLRQVFEQGYPPSFLPRLDFYEAGFYLDGSPWWRSAPEYTCAYCENLFAVLGLDKIWVPYDRRWVKCATSDSFYTSALYATGAKKP